MGIVSWNHMMIYTFLVMGYNVTECKQLFFTIDKYKCCLKNDCNGYDYYIWLLCMIIDF